MVNSKQKIGLLILCVGVVLIFVAFHRMGYVPKHKLKIITNTPVENVPNSGVIIAGPKRTGPLVVLVTGIALFVFGAGIVVYCQHRKT